MLGRRRRRRLRFRFRLVDDEPLGVAGEWVEAELEGAGRTGGGHSAAAEEEAAESGRRWAWRDAREEAARHRRTARRRRRQLPSSPGGLSDTTYGPGWSRKSPTKPSYDGLSPLTASRMRMCRDGKLATGTYPSGSTIPYSYS